MTRRWWWMGLSTGLTVAVVGPLAGQSVRVSGVTSFQYLNVRPFADDSIAVGEAVGSGLLRRAPDGQVVRCVAGDEFCRFRRTGSAASTVPMIQDVGVSVWGLGRGIRAYGRFRGRAMVTGDESLWPQVNDVVEVSSAYVEIDRTRFRARLGRMWRASGLGYYNYDGAAVLVRPHRWVTVEGYGGWSLVQGSNESVLSEDFAAVESFAPETRAYLFGAQATVRPRSGVGITAGWQREIRDDRLGLYSERVSADGTWRIGRVAIDAAFRYDLAAREVNEARIQGWLPRVGPVAVRVHARRNRPFFPLWTIWGAFNPLGFDELGVSASWSRAGSPVSLQVSGSGRRYEGPASDSIFGQYRTDGWRVGAGAGVELAPDWTLFGQYQAELGFGAAASDGSARLQRDFGRGMYVALNGAVFQRLYEFRLDEGTILALGTDASVRYGARMTLTGGVTAYRHAADTKSGRPGWTQVRASLRAEWSLGAEPVVTGWGGRRP